MASFPLSAKSLDLPLYIIRHYKAAKQDGAAKSAVDEAVAYYLGLKSKQKEDKGRFILQGLTVRAYVEGGQWQDALDGLDKIARDYPKNSPEEALWMKALIYTNKMKDKLKAKEELQKIINEYPQSKLAKAAQELLKRIKP